MGKKFIFKWDPESLCINVDAMDKDHQVLIGLMNDVYELYKKQAPRNSIGSSLNKLGAFVVDHFNREEKYFETVEDYPDVEIHKAIHKKLVNGYTNYVKEFNAGTDLTDEFFFFLKAWLVAHIEGVDAKYGNPNHGIHKKHSA